MNKLLIILSTVVVLAGLVYLVGGTRLSEPPGRLVVIEPKEAFNAELLRRYPRGSAAQPLRDALVQAGVTYAGPIPQANAERVAKQPFTYDRPTTLELFQKNRFGSPDPHMMILVVDANDTIVDIVVYY